MKFSYFVNGEMGLGLIGWVLEHHRADVSVIIGFENNFQLKVLSEKFQVTYLISEPGEAAEIELCDKLRMMEIDIGYLLWWPRILSPKLLKSTKFGFLNLYPSLLPNGRGKNPNFWAIASGEQFGVTIHWVDEKIDHGPIVAQRAIEVSWVDTGKTLYEKSLRELFSLFTETYCSVSKFEFPKVPNRSIAQNGSYHNELDMFNASQIVLDQSYTARELLNLLRARTFEGKPGCTFFENGKQYSIQIAINDE